MKYLTFLGLALALSACNYSNTFTGTYNGVPATMDAYSKNINKYCVALNIKAGDQTLSSYISAQSVFNPSDILKPMSFNTKGATCGSNLDHYLVGYRNTTVLNISPVTLREQLNMDYCRFTTYNNYQFKEDISFAVKSNANDSVMGNFSGVGGISQFIDRDHPIQYGPIFYCGTTRPGQWPYPPYPYPMPRPRPFPWAN